MNWKIATKELPKSKTIVLGATNFGEYCICFLAEDGKTWIESQTGNQINKWLTFWHKLPEFPETMSEH